MFNNFYYIKLIEETFDIPPTPVPSFGNSEMCVVCREAYDDSDAVILMLRCGHEVCDRCEMRLRTDGHSCPFCRAQGVYY